MLLTSSRFLLTLTSVSVTISDIAFDKGCYGSQGISIALTKGSLWDFYRRIGYRAGISIAFANRSVDLSAPLISLFSRLRDWLSRSLRDLYRLRCPLS